MLRRMINGLPLGLAVMASVVAATALYFSVQEPKPNTLILQTSNGQEEIREGEVTISLDARDLESILDQAERTQQDADNAANSADAILGFIESGSILLGALIAVGVIVFGLSIQDVRSRLDDSLVEAEKKLQESENRIEDSIQNGEVRIHENEARMDEMTARIEASIRETESTRASLENLVQDAVRSAKQEAEKSFRVLSLLLLAEQQVRARNRETALSSLEEAYKLDPTNQITNYLLGYLYVNRKEFDRAIEHLNNALKADENFAPALAAMGLAQRRMGDTVSDPENELERHQLWAQAEYNLNKALAADSGLIDADNESYFGTLGGLYRRQKRDEEALRAYENAVKVTPNNSYPVGNLASLYKKLGYEDEAQRMYERSLEIAEAILDDNPGDTWARLDLAQALLVLGDKNRALDQYQNVIGRIQEPAPLESALSGLNYLADAPQPIVGLDETIDLLQRSIARLQKQKSKT